MLLLYLTYEVNDAVDFIGRVLFNAELFEVDVSH